MKTTPFTLQGQTYHLCMNAAALYDIYDRFGTEEPILSHIEGTDRKSYDATCWMLAKLCEQGEIVRRYEGFDKGPFVSEHAIRTKLSPLDVPMAKQAIAVAVRLGFAREEPDDKPIDKGLLELEKKTASAPPAPDTCRRRRSFLACLFGRPCCCRPDRCGT